MIDKLPFAVPSDPLVQARAEAIRRAGGDAFNELQLPQAVLALKQGVGRLIRDFDDRGLIVLGDPRLRTRAYGATFLASLPAMPVIDDFDEALEFAASLAETAAEPAAARVMNLLGFETSSRVGSVALETPAGVLVREIATPREQTEQLLALTDELLAAAGIGLQDLDGIAFGRGPGLVHGAARQRRRRAGSRCRQPACRCCPCRACCASRSAPGASTAASARSSASTRTWARSTRPSRERRGGAVEIVGDERLGAPAEVVAAGRLRLVRRRQRLRGACRGAGGRDARGRAGAAGARARRPRTCCRRRKRDLAAGRATAADGRAARVFARAHGLETQFLT